MEVLDLALLATVVELVGIFLSEVVVIIIFRPVVISRINWRVFVYLRVFDQVNTHIHMLHATVLAFQLFFDEEILLLLDNGTTPRFLFIPLV